MGLTFQVAEVKKPLVAVKRITEMGNRVSFGPEEDENFILNIKSGQRVKLKPNGRGSYLMRVKLVGGSETDITVDSGAEESVCLTGWGEQFGVTEPDKRLSLVNASGSKISHYGQRQVQVEALF